MTRAKKSLTALPGQAFKFGGKGSTKQTSKTLCSEGLA
jgi:hypothetical protein